ncbi:MAG: hypothetical protein JKY33_10565 [Bacteroidia bacterium]|nr:hypothetical protein [Bacteroidia bacterium]
MPEINEISDWLIGAFNYLSPLRIEKVGMHGSIIKGVIPVSEITSYITVFPLLIPCDEFANIIRSLDGVYLNDLREKIEQKDKARKTKGK